jgi:hypothetical protein
MTSREFNQDRARAKREAARGPVYITDRGRPSHVLLSIEDYNRLAAAGRPDIVELLGSPPGIEDVAFEPPQDRTVAEPPRLD